MNLKWDFVIRVPVWKFQSIKELIDCRQYYFCNSNIKNMDITMNADARNFASLERLHLYKLTVSKHQFYEIHFPSCRTKRRVVHRYKISASDRISDLVQVNKLTFCFGDRFENLIHLWNLSSFLYIHFSDPQTLCKQQLLSCSLVQTPSI